MKTILVLGATGKTGRHLVPALLDRGLDVRAATRNPGAYVGAQGALPVLFDWSDKGSWAGALDGADGVYLIKPEGGGVAVLVSEFLSLMTEAGASRLVLHSEVAADFRSEDDEERRVEVVVEQSALDWTIIRPNWFVQDLADEHFFASMIRDQGIMVMTTGGSAVSWIDTRDIAATAVELLLDASLCRHEALMLTGPEALTLDGLADRLTALTGRQIVSIEETLSEAEERMRKDNLPEDYVAYLTRLNTSIIEGHTSKLTDHVERLTGRRPRPVNDFLAESSLRQIQDDETSSHIIQSNEALFRRQIEAWAAADIDKLVACYNDDMVYVDMPFLDQPVHGVDAFRAHMIDYNGQFDRSDFTAEILTLVANETHVVGELLCTARYIGPGAPAGGVVVSWHATLFETIVEGKISSEKAYFDPSTLEKALARESS